MTDKKDWQKIIVIAIAVCFLCYLFLIPMLRQPRLVTPAGTVPINPLAAELDKANMLIDSLVSFNNLLIKELEECEDERLLEED